MNLPPELAVWLRPMGLIAAEVAVLVAVATLVQRLVRSPAARRALWQACVLGVLVLLAAELSGVGRDFAASLTAEPKPQTQSRNGAFSIANRQPPIARRIRVPERSSRRALDAEGAGLDPSSSVPLRLRDDVRQRIAERVAVNRTSGGTEPLTQGEPGPTPIPVPAPATSMDFPELTWIGLAWVLGSGLFLLRVFTARLLSAWFRLRSRPVTDSRLMTAADSLAARLDLRPSLSLKESARLRGPIAFGVLRPTIILPAGFASEFTGTQQEAMLAHEIAHLAARDPLWHLLADLAAALLWWHPLVWWARRRLHVANEAAADLASVLVADGPQVLAECLVQLGNRLAQREALGWLGVTGFRSQLGLRVEQLLSLHHGEWRPLDRWRSALAKALGALAVVALTLFGTAWALPQSVTQGENMRTIRQSWKQSLAAFALLASATLEPGAAAEPTSVNTPLLPASAPSLGATEAREPSGIEIEAKETKLNHETGEFTARGDARLRSGRFELSAEEIHGNQRTGVLTPKGETWVRFFREASGSEPVAMEYVTVDSGGKVVASRPVWDGRAREGSVDEVREELTLRGGALRMGEVRLTADTLTFDPKERALTAAGNVQLKVPPNVICLPQPDPIMMERYGLAPRAFAGATAPTVRPAPSAPATVPAAQNAPLMDPRMMERYGLKPAPASASATGVDHYYPDMSVVKAIGLAAQASGTGVDPHYAAEENRRRMMSRYGLGPRSPAGTPAAAGGSSGVEPGGGFGGGAGMGGGLLKSGSALEGKLDQIRFDEVTFQGLPLSEVLLFLNEQSRERDPEKKGINFLINPNTFAAAPAPAVDPTTGQLVPVPAAEPLDMNSVLVRFNLPLREVRLKDVLDAVVKVADKPIRYTVEDYAVVFSQNAEATPPSNGVAPGPTLPGVLSVRTFKVATNNFAAGLEHAFGVKLGPVTGPADVGRSKQMQSALRQLLTQLGVAMEVPGKAVFYNELTGVIMVRGTVEDLEIVEAAIGTLGGSANDSTAASPASAMSEEMMRRYGLSPARR